MDEIIKYNEGNISFEESLKFFREFSVKSKDYTYLPPNSADNKDFGSDFPGSLIHKPRYTNCRFHLSKFIASNGAFSIFDNCYLYDCYFKGANFNYCNFYNCKFIYKKKFLVENTGFNYSQFSNVRFEKVSFEGISFRDIYLENSTFDECVINNSSFERAIIKNSSFKNMDLRNIGIRYCQFFNVDFDNVVFPILDLANNIGLHDIIKQQSDKIRFSLGYTKEVDFDEAKKLLLLLVPYYNETNQYFSILNVFLLNEKYDEVLTLLQRALDYSIKKFDFDSLYNICKLIADAKIFDSVTLRRFFEKIKNAINPLNFPYNIQKGYLHYMDEIKNILLNNPCGYPSITIELTTNISSKEPQLLLPIINDIERVVAQLNSGFTPSIKISHNSPYDIVVTLFGAMPQILQLCQIFYYSFGGLKSLKDIKGSKHEKTRNTSDAKVDVEKHSKTQLSFGSFQFSKETKKTVKTMEYYISNR